MRFGLFCFFFLFSLMVRAQFKTEIVEVDSAFSRTSVNTAIFRCNALTTLGDTQFIAFYDPKGYLVLGKRCLKPKNKKQESFILKRSNYRIVNRTDAHNVISIVLDGKGYLHVAFDHHNSPLKYCKSVAPFSLELGKLQGMISDDIVDAEKDVTYPEFYRFKNGDLFFVYRCSNNIVMNRYLVEQGKWVRVWNNILENQVFLRPYWQIYVDNSDIIHISWLWRENAYDAQTNKNLYYICSKDYGQTWLDVRGDTLGNYFRRVDTKPIMEIERNSNFINQTSMASDINGRPYIATYFRKDSITNYHVIYYDGEKFRDIMLGNRKEDFSLSGMGTLYIPISRPKILVGQKMIYFLFRDEDLGSKVSLYYSKLEANKPLNFKLANLTDDSYQAWEPAVDIDLWKSSERLDIFLQKTYQISDEKISNVQPTMVKVLTLKK